MSRTPLVVALTLLTARAAAAQATERFTLRGADAAVYDPAGRVQVVAGSGSDVVVEVTRRGRDAGRLRVLTGEVRGQDALRIVAPGNELVYPELGRNSQTSFRVRSDGTFGDEAGGKGIFSSLFSSNQLTVRGDGSGPEAYADVVVRVPAGHRVTVQVGAGAATAQDVNGDLKLGTRGGNVVTERTRGRLVVGTGSGSVRVHDAQGSEVNLDTGSGSAEVRGVRADRLHVDTGSGSVEGGDLDVRDANIDTGSGSARFDRVRARRLKIDTGSGSVDLELVGDVDDVRLDTGSGGVTLRVPPTLGATLDIDAGSGGIHTDVPVQVSKSEHGHLTGRVGDGRGRIVVDTGSGGVRIVPAK